MLQFEDSQFFLLQVCYHIHSFIHSSSILLLISLIQTSMPLSSLVIFVEQFMSTGFHKRNFPSLKTITCNSSSSCNNWQVIIYKLLVEAIELVKQRVYNFILSKDLFFSRDAWRRSCSPRLSGCVACISCGLG